MLLSGETKPFGGSAIVSIEHLSTSIVYLAMWAQKLVCNSLWWATAWGPTSVGKCPLHIDWKAWGVKCFGVAKAKCKDHISLVVIEKARSNSLNPPCAAVAEQRQRCGWCFAPSWCERKAAESCYKCASAQLLVTYPALVPSCCVFVFCSHLYLRSTRG